MNILKYALATVMCFALIGCDTQVTSKDLDEKKDKIAELEQELKEARASGESSERIAELEAELKTQRDEYAALEQRHDYEEKMERQLRELDRKIDGLQDQAADADGDREIELRKKVAELRTLYDQLAKKIDELKVASGEGWTDSKEAVEEGWKETSDKVEQALKDTSVEDKTDGGDNETDESTDDK